MYIRGEAGVPRGGGARRDPGAAARAGGAGEAGDGGGRDGARRCCQVLSLLALLVQKYKYWRRTWYKRANTNAEAVSREQEHNQTFTLLKLLQAKTKAHSKSMRMLGTELDAVKRAAKSSEQDLAAKVLVYEACSY
jgi:hypothetical protein